MRDKISDYYDSNDEIGLDGMEAEEYEAENMAPLPRNSSTKVLREEFFYIPGLIDLFPPDRFGRLSIIRLLRAPSGAPSFFTATPLLLKVYCNLEDEEIEEVLAAREIWFKERTTLRDQLDPMLYASLGRFSWRESGTYTILIGQQEKQERPTRRLAVSFERFDVTGAADNNVKLIEKDKERCFFLADRLKSTLVINGDGRDLALLREEGIRTTDAFICLTGSSETNILTCLLAKKLGVKKTVAEVENIDYTDLAENLGIGTLINTKLIAAANIYRYTINVNVKHLKFVTFSEAEVFEVTVEPGAKITGGTLAELDFPDNANVGGIIRNGEAIIAKGDVRIEAGDDVVIFALPSAVKKVLRMFRK